MIQGHIYHVFTTVATVFCVALLSCVRHPNHEFVYSEEDSIEDIIGSFIVSTDPNYNELISFASKLPKYNNYDIIDDYLYLFFDDNKEKIVYDFYNNNSLIDPDY